LCFNARSIIPKLDSFKCTIELLKPDAIGVTESWATEEISDEELSIPGYDLYRQDRSSKHRGGGVLLYVKANLCSTRFTTKAEFPEQVWCKVPLKTGQDLLIGVCYRTPTPGIFNLDLDKSLCELITEVSHQHLLLMGDFNYGDINWSLPVYHTSLRPWRLAGSLLNA
jgi:hypothetical protein